MSDMISVRGARENNLADVSVDIPKRKLTVFTGVSGSGKSSLVFGTIAAESQRLINETYSAFLQSFMPSLGRPDVDALRGLTAAIIVDQERMGANARSTVGTATDAYTMLRIVFSRLGQPHVGNSLAYSFNAEGACPTCEGLGRVSAVDVDEVVDRTRSLRDGAITVPGFTPDNWYVQSYIQAGFVDPDKPLEQFTKTEWADFLHKPPTKVRVGTLNVTYEGLVVKLTRLYLGKDREALQPHLRAFVDRAATFSPCPDCGGTRLNAAVLASKIRGRNIADCAALQVSELAAFVRTLDQPGVAPLVATLGDTLDSMVGVGLGYLSLDRDSTSLSGGEAQRIKMVRHLGSSLTDVTYVFDEPTGACTRTTSSG